NSKKLKSLGKGITQGPVTSTEEGGLNIVHHKKKRQAPKPRPIPVVVAGKPIRMGTSLLARVRKARVVSLLGALGDVDEVEDEAVQTAIDIARSNENVAG